MKPTTNEALSEQIAKLSLNQAVMLEQLLNVKEDVSGVKEDIKDVKTKLDNNYATKEWVYAEYGQTKKIVNGMVVVVLLAVLSALVGMVIIK